MTEPDRFSRLSPPQRSGNGFAQGSRVHGARIPPRPSRLEHPRPSLDRSAAATLGRRNLSVPRRRRRIPPRLVGVLAMAIWVPVGAAAQRRAEVEIEREGRTMSRVEVYDGAVPVLRAERELDSAPLQRLGLRMPGAVLDVDGYVAVFVEDRPDRTDVGTAFEVGRGVPMLGGSLERGEDRFAGLYLKLRGANAEIAGGGGRLNGDLVGHGALYVKGARWSAAAGGSRGPHGMDYAHFAATWHPVQRGTAPGARLIAERGSGNRYFAELMLVDRADFNHFAVWGQYGMDQWPHRKAFEAVGDITRYVRPPTFLHGYTSGALAVSGGYEVIDGEREFTIDVRGFPLRALLSLSGTSDEAVRSGLSGYVVGRVLPTIMLGGYRNGRAGTNAWVGEIGFPPFSVYFEAPTRHGVDPYLFVQYGRELPF